MASNFPPMGVFRPPRPLESDSTVSSPPTSDGRRCSTSTPPEPKTWSGNIEVFCVTRSHQTTSPSKRPPSPIMRKAKGSQDISSSHHLGVAQGNKSPAPSSEESEGQGAQGSSASVQGSLYWPPRNISSRTPTPFAPRSTTGLAQPTTSEISASPPPRYTTPIAAPRPDLESYRPPGNFERLFPVCQVTEVIRLPQVFCEPRRRRDRGASRYAPY